MIDKNKKTLEKIREANLQMWFQSWLVDEANNFASNVFTDDVTYIECWGPKYEKIQEVRGWFINWKQKNKVIIWNIHNYLHKNDQTVVTWTFACLKNYKQDDEMQIKFDGVSIVHWIGEEISYLHEYGSKISESIDDVCFVCESKN